MEQVKKDWLGKIVGKQLLSEDRARVDRRKDAVRSKVAQDVSNVSGKLLTDNSLKVSNGRDQQELLSYGVRDQRREFDLDDQQDGFTLTSDEDVGKHLEASRLVSQLSNQFDEEIEVIKLDKHGDPVIGSDGKPEMEKKRLFDDADLGADFYQPLVRQGLLPETFVPDDYSETEKMVKASFDVYAERLKKDYEKSDIKRFMKENKSLALTSIGSGLSLASQGLAIKELGNFDMAKAIEESKDSLSWVKELSSGDAGAIIETTSFGWELVSETLPEAVEDIHEAVTDEPEEHEHGKKAAKKAHDAQVLRMANLGAAGMAAALGTGLSAWSLEMTASAAFTGRLKVGQLTKELCTEPLTADAVGRAADVCGDAFVETMTVCDPALAAAGQAIKTAFRTALAPAAVINALKTGAEKYPVLVQLLTTAAQTAVEAGTSGDAVKQILDNGKKEIQAKLSKAVVDDVVAAANREDEAAEREKQALENETDAKRLASLIDKKIAALKKQQALLKWSTTVVGMGFDIASKFLAPMAIGGSALKLAVNIGQAAARMSDFLAFTESKGDMLRAASPFSAPLDNFLDNASLQAAHYSVVAAYELINMIGAIVETAGLASGMGAAAGVIVGKAMQAGAASGQAIEAVLYEIKKRYDVEQGWKMYKTALLRPANRKLGLIALAGNPTLAKYSVAWGAVVLKDPLVGDFMGACGLDATTLQDPKSSLDKVQKYLETRMPDDSVLVGRMPVAQDWEPGNIALTCASWTSVVRRAEAQAGLVPKETRAIDLSLMKFEGTLRDLRAAAAEGEKDPAKKPTADAVRLGRDQLGQVDKAFQEYNPRRKADGHEIRHEQMWSVVGKFQAKSKAARTELDKMV